MSAGRTLVILPGTGRGTGERAPETSLGEAVPAGSRHYEIEVTRLSVEDGGGFVAVAPELPGCRSDGETPEEALRNGYDAVACWIEAATEQGRAVPEPRRRAA